MCIHYAIFCCCCCVYVWVACGCHNTVECTQLRRLSLSLEKVSSNNLHNSSARYTRITLMKYGIWYRNENSCCTARRKWLHSRCSATRDWLRHSGRKIYVTDERYALILCNVKGIQVNPSAMHALEVQFPRFNPNQIRLSSWMHCNRRRRQLSTHWIFHSIVWGLLFPFRIFVKPFAIQLR